MQVTAIHLNANSIPQSHSRHTDWKTIAEHTLHMATNNSQTGVPNDLRFFMLMRKLDLLKLIEIKFTNHFQQND